MRHYLLGTGVIPSGKRPREGCACSIKPLVAPGLRGSGPHRGPVASQAGAQSPQRLHFWGGRSSVVREIPHAGTGVTSPSTEGRLASLSICLGSGNPPAHSCECVLFVMHAKYLVLGVARLGRIPPPVPR